MKTYVVVAGNIGAGKTTLVEMMSERLGWQPYFEPVTENPYLSDFYRDMRQWAFHSQVFFLTHRARSHRALLDIARPAVQDRSFYEDAQVFARALHLQGAMSERDWSTYEELYRTLTTLLAPPNLVVYLRASVATLRRRIELRGRAIEAAISDDYLSSLNMLYEEWIESFDLAPVLVVPADEMDFVEDPQHLGEIMTMVEERLRGQQRSLFPEGS